MIAVIDEWWGGRKLHHLLPRLWLQHFAGTSWVCEEADGRLRGFVVVRSGASVSEQDVKEYVKSRLARFKVPRDVVFVDELPRNPTGKVVKRLLAAE